MSFNALADEVRKATAGLYLGQPDIALAEIGNLLGFASQSAFNRAFKQLDWPHAQAGAHAGDGHRIGEPGGLDPPGGRPGNRHGRGRRRGGGARSHGSGEPVRMGHSAWGN